MLSIAIPTRNRSEFLRFTLDKIKAGFPDAEIILSDNASSDATRFYRHEVDQYLRQPEDIGAFPNMREALLAAKGEYAVFCADDDYLLPERVQAGIAFLEAHPAVVAYFAPCQLWDEVNGSPDWNAFYVANDETFTDPGKLWNFLIQNHVWPEHAIYRVSALQAIMKPRIRAYWCFIDLAHAMAAGSVHFASQPYYRNLTNHPMGFRSKLGDRQCLTDFDEYRAGLENLACDLFANHLTDELKSKLRVMINHFINMRLGVAHRLLSMQGKQDEAQSIEKRLRICA